LFLWAGWPTFWEANWQLRWKKPSVSPNVKPRKFSVEEYALMGEVGVFAPGERVELIEGEIIPVGPHNKNMVCASPN
jgi:hypothetical protein